MSAALPSIMAVGFVPKVTTTLVSIIALTIHGAIAHSCCCKEGVALYYYQIVGSSLRMIPIVRLASLEHQPVTAGRQMKVPPSHSTKLDEGLSRNNELTQLDSTKSPVPVPWLQLLHCISGKLPTLVKAVHSTKKR